MDLSGRRKLLAACLFTTALALFVPVPQPLRFVLAFLQVFYLPGFVCITFLGGRERSPWDELFMPLVISPIIVVAVTLVARAATPAFASCLIAAFAALYVLLAVALATRRFDGKPPAATLPHAIVLEAIALSAIIAVTYLVNDSLFALDTSRQAAVSYEILLRGFPPKEPFFADMPIKNMWFQYLFHAVWHRLSGIPLVTALWIVNLVVAFTFPYVVARFASCFTARRGYIAAAPLFAVAGIGAASWVLWPLNIVRAFFGSSRGLTEIAAIARETNLDGRSVLQFLTPPGLHPLNFMDKLLIIDVHQYSVILFILCLTLALERCGGNGSKARAAATILIVMAGAFAFRIVTGLALVSSAIVAGIILAAFGAVRSARRAPAFFVLVVPALAALTGVCGLLFYRHMTGAWGDGIFVPDRLGLSVENLLTIAAPLAVLMPFSWRAIRGIFGGQTCELRTVAAWMAALIISSALIDLRGNLECYFIYPLSTILAVFIGWRIIDRVEASSRARRSLLIAWGALLFAVPPALTVRGYVLERPAGAHYERRYRIPEEDLRLYEWIRDSTSTEAVIIERNEYNVMTYYTGRRNFYMTEWEIPNFGYRGAAVDRYRAIRDAIYAAEPVPSEAIEYLRGMRRDIFVVLWAEDIAARPDLVSRFSSRPEWFRPVFENRAGSVYVVTKG